MPRSPLRRWHVILNRDGGTMRDLDAGETAERIRAIAGGLGIDAEVDARPGSEIVAALDAATAAPKAEAIVVGGGDGTISAAAARLVGKDAALGVLPLGTMNLFARTLDVPFGLEEAVTALATGEIQEITVGEANGRVFVNHVSFGLHPWLIRHRERQLHRRRGSKIVASLIAFVRGLIRQPRVEMEMAVDGDATPLSTPLAIIAATPFAEHDGPVPRSGDPSWPRLAMYLAVDGGRLGMLRLAMSAAAGHWQGNEQFRYLETEQLTVTPRRRRVLVSVDGEVVEMTERIEIASRPRALKVLRPAPSRPATPDAAVAAVPA